MIFRVRAFRLCLLDSLRSLEALSVIETAQGPEPVEGYDDEDEGREKRINLYLGLAELYITYLYSTC